MVGEAPRRSVSCRAQAEAQTEAGESHNSGDEVMWEARVSGGVSAALEGGGDGREGRGASSSPETGRERDGGGGGKAKGRRRSSGIVIIIITIILTALGLVISLAICSTSSACSGKKTGILC